MDNCTIGNKVLVHLSCFSRFKEEYVCPSEMTQDGMALKLGISRAHAALELKRLKDRNQVEHKLAHVVAAKTRRKVYSLTPVGEMTARDLKDAARMKRMQLLDGNGGMECTGQEAIKALCAMGFSESEATIKVLTSEAVPAVGGECGWRSKAIPEVLVGRDREFNRLNRWLHSSGKAVCVLSGPDGVGKTALARALFAGKTDSSIWLGVRSVQSVSSLLSEIGGHLATAGKPRLQAMLDQDEIDEREAALTIAEDMAGGLIVLDDSHNSSAVEGFASLFMFLNDWPIKVLVVGRRKPSFCHKWSDTFQKPYEDIGLEGLDIESARLLLNGRATSMTDEGLSAAHRATEGRPLDLLILTEFGWQFDRSDVPALLGVILPRLNEEEADALRLLSVLRIPLKSSESPLTPGQSALFNHRSLFQVDGDNCVLHESVWNKVSEGIGPEEKAALSERAARFEQSLGHIIDAATHLLAAGMRQMAVDLLVSNMGSLPVRDRSLEMLSMLRAIGAEERLDAVRGRVLEMNGQPDEARLCYERVLSNSSGRTAVEMLMRLGELETKMALPHEAERRFAEAERISSFSGDEFGQANAKLALAHLRRLSGVLDASMEQLGHAKALFERAGRLRQAAQCYAEIGRIRFDQGDIAGAVVAFSGSLEMLGSHDGESAQILCDLAQARARAEDYEGALSDYVGAADIAKDLGQARTVARSLVGAAECGMALGRSEEASEHCRKALRLGERLGDNPLLSTVHATLGTLNRKLGMWNRAESHLFKSIELMKASSSPQGLAMRYKDLAALYVEKGDTRKSRIWSTRADKIREWEGRVQRPSWLTADSG